MMPLPHASYATILFWATQGLCAGVVILALALVPYREFKRRPEFQHVFYATTLLVAVLWWLGAPPLRGWRCISWE